MFDKDGHRLSRGELRLALLKSRKPKSQIIELFGEEVEIRQPTLGQILDIREEDSLKARAVSIIIERVFVPGTDENVFEEGDREALLNMPFGDEIAQINNVINELSGINMDDAEKNSEAIPTDS